MEKKFKVIELLPLKTGVSERGEWKMQEVILEEVADEHRDCFLVTFKGEKVEMLQSLKVGDEVTANWSASVRRYEGKDGRLYHSQQLYGWKIEALYF